MIFTITFKGSPDSGWYSPPKGTHTGEKHRAVGSGRTGAERGLKGIVRIDADDDLYRYAVDSKWREWRNGISKEEVGAYLIYSTEHVEVSMNDYWRNRSEYQYDEKLEVATRAIDRTMRENPAEVEGHRAVDIEFYNQMLRPMEIGESFTDKGYTSTSLMSHDYSEARVLKIRIARGVKVAYLAPMDAYELNPILSPSYGLEEWELLVHRGATMTKVGMEGDVSVFEIRS